ncbi:MAG: YgjV family protein [Clostridia bacterium]|nr:YgjV family protein [Clostridia bacterium]
MNETTIKFIIEGIGYLGSFLVLISMLMTSVVKLRIINAIGSAIFAAYAILISSWPTAVLNICLFLINIYHLVRLMRVKKSYKLVRTNPRDGYLASLLEDNKEDIHIFFPDSSLDTEDATLSYLICCGNAPAGLFFGKETGEDGKDIEILLDYALPAFRDTSVGKFLFERLASEGYRSLVFRGNAPKHTEYMKKVGFLPTENGAQKLDLGMFLK